MQKLLNIKCLCTSRKSNLSSALPDGFEEEDGGGDGDVEGVQSAEHRDADVLVSGLAPDVGQAG